MRMIIFFLFPSFQLLSADTAIFLPASASTPTMEDQKAPCPGGTVGPFSCGYGDQKV